MQFILEALTFWLLLMQTTVSEQANNGTSSSPSHSNKVEGFLPLEKGRFEKRQISNGSELNASGRKNKLLSVSDNPPHYVMALFSTLLLLTTDELFDMFCSAVAISPNYLLSSASCVCPYQKQPFSIYACNFLLCDLIETVTIHPEYNPTTRENNIALLKTYGKLRILPLTVACLPLPYTNLDGEIASMIEVYDLIVQDDETGEEYPAKREKVTNNDPNYNSFKSSFNTQHRSKREPKERQISQELADLPMNYSEIITPIISNKDCCQRFKNHYVTVTSKMMCAESNFEPNFCDGDDGAALIIECERQPVVVGIQSYCVSSNFPTIFTRISKYFYWIQKHINYGACALRCTLPYYNGKDRNDDGSDNCNYYGSQDGRFHGPHNNYETYKDGNVPYTGYYNGQNGYASYPTYKAYNIGNSHPYHYNRYGSYNAYNPNYNDGIPDYKKERSDLKSNSSSKSSTIIGNNLSQMKSPIASYKRVG